MKSSLASILFAALLGISTSSFQDGGSYPIHVDISVYYESYCPYRLVRSNFDLNLRFSQQNSMHCKYSLPKIKLCA